MFAVHIEIIFSDEVDLNPKAKFISVEPCPIYMNYNWKSIDLNKSEIRTMKAYTCIYTESSYTKNSFYFSFIQFMTTVIFIAWQGFFYTRYHKASLDHALLTRTARILSNSYLV